MAMELASSPRISFSQDLSQSDLSTPTNRRFDSSLSLDSSSPDFDFSVSCEISIQEPSPADELFSDGKILPLPIKNSGGNAPPPIGSPAPSDLDLDRKGSLKEIMNGWDDEDDGGGGGAAAAEKPIGRHKSFWGFGRSCSLNSGSKASLICSFTLLSRSKSAGSNAIPSPNPNPTPKQRRHYYKTKNNSNNNSSTRKAAYYYSGSNKGSCGNGVRISPILNVPAPYIPRGGSSSNGMGLFEYLLCSCKDKNMKRSAIPCSP